MHAFIVHQVDLPNSPDTLNIIPDKSIGIDDIRQIQFFLSRKPVAGDHNTVVIHAAHLLTPPAQHALLKTLEEPPPGALIYLVTTTPDSLLPTILSRVQIIPSTQHLAPSPQDLSKSKTLLEKLQNAGVGDRLKILEEQEFTRESALAFLDDLEYLIHQDLSPLNARRYTLISDTRRYLKANCNLKLSLSHLAINL